jgi:hypothetical protein
VKSTPQSASSQRRGAYGFRLEGLEAAGDVLVTAPRSWPALHVAVERGRARVPHDRMDDHTADLRLQTVDGSIRLERESGRVTFSVPAELTPAALVHPFLAPAVLVAAHWMGRETFHAGTFVCGGVAWGVLGHKGEGKSTLLAWLARGGVPVLADDVLIVDNGHALAGPRSIDLRAGSAAHLGTGDALGHVGARERWRVTLATVPASVPIGGFVHLRWADAVGVRRLRGTAKLRALAEHRGVRRDAVACGGPLMDLSALPSFEFRRPRDWSSMEAAGEQLLAALSAS